MHPPLTVLLALALLAGACQPDACLDSTIPMPIPVTMRLDFYKRDSGPDGTLSAEECTRICQAFVPTLLVVDRCEAGDPQYPDGGPDTASVTGVATIPIGCWGRFACR